MGQALRVLVVRASLSGRAMQVISTRQWAALTPDPQRLFLGFGFEWQPVTDNGSTKLAKVHWRDYAVSPWLLRLLGYAVIVSPKAELGLPYIHGVEPRMRTGRCRTSRAAR